MHIREYFVIRHIASGQFMPQEVPAGFTKWEPEDYKDIETAPRLFLSEAAAMKSAWWWSRGICTKGTKSDDGPFGSTVTIQDGFLIEEVTSRSRDDLETVRVTMTFTI